MRLLAVPSCPIGCRASRWCRRGGQSTSWRRRTGSLTAAERELVSAVRANPGGARELLWETGQWFVDTPLRFLEAAPEAAEEPVLRDPVVRSNFAASNLEEARQGRPVWLRTGLPTRFRGASSCRDWRVGRPLDWRTRSRPGATRRSRDRTTRPLVRCSRRPGRWALAADLALARHPRTKPLLTKRCR
jgi:hypothetical protein